MVRKALRAVQTRHQSKGTAGRVLIVRDGDDEGPLTTAALDSLRGQVQQLGGEVDGPGAWELEGCLVQACVLGSASPLVPGIPEKQTLERLACASLAQASVERGESVARWLLDEPLGGQGHEEHAWSWYAKWFARHGTGHFYRQLWQQPEVVEHLEEQLRALGSWQAMEWLLSGDE